MVEQPRQSLKDDDGTDIHSRATVSDCDRSCKLGPRVVGFSPLGNTASEDDGQQRAVV